jgi:general secretion pathway protein D
MGLGRRSASRVGLLAALGLGLVISTGLRSAADDVDSPGQIMIQQFAVQDATLQSAINFLRLQTGIDIILLPSEKPYGLVNATLSNKPLDVVLKHMVASAGAAVKYEAGVYTIGPKEEINRQPVFEPTRKEIEQPAPPRRARWERIRLQNSRPSELVQALGINQGNINALEHHFLYNNLLDLKTGGLGLNALPRNSAMPRSLSNIESEAERGSVPPVVPTGGGQGNGNKNEEGQIGGIGGGGFGGGGQRGGGLGGVGGGGFGGGGQGRGGIGGQGGQGAQNLLPTGIDSLLAYDVDNTLIVRYTDEDALRELKEIVRLLDVAPKQLMIRAEFIEVRQDDLRSFGIDWQLSRGALTASTFEGAYAQGDIVLNYATGNLVSQLRTSLVEGKGRIVNSPMATTTNNVPVTIQLGTTVPVITTSVVFGNNGNGATVPQIVPIQVVSGLTAVPRINGDGSISMFVAPFIQDIVSEVANPAGGTIPIISSQFVPVVRRIGNNETMVIGGLIKKNDRSSVKKVPLLADLPLVGNLFRSTSMTVSDSELLIFVTPTILPDPVSQPVSGTTPFGGAGAAGGTPRP